MKKLLLIFLAGMFLFSSCGRVQQKKQHYGKKVITIWQTYNNEEHQVFVNIVKKFEDRNPEIKLNVQRIPWGGHQTKLLVSMVTHTAPDICRVDVGIMPRLVKSGTIIDLTEYGALEIAENLMPAAVNSNIYPESFFIAGSTSSKKHIFGLPDQTTGVALFYNRKLFKKAGVSSLPANWNEFIEVARKLTIDTNNDGRPDIYGFGMWGGLWFNFPFFNTFGVKFTDESGKKCLLYSENAKNALSLMLKIANSGIEGGAWQTGAINPELGFLQEMYAMVFAGPWNVKRFKDAGIDFGVVLIPEGPAGTSTNVGGTNMVILRETKYPRECYEFLKFFTSPEVQAEWCNALGQIPVNTKAIPKIDFSKNPEIKVFTEQMKTAIARPPVLDYDRLEEIMTAEIYAVLSKQKTPDKALNDAVKRIENEVLSFE